MKASGYKKGQAWLTSTTPGIFGTALRRQPNTRDLTNLKRSVKSKSNSDAAARPSELKILNVRRIIPATNRALSALGTA